MEEGANVNFSTTSWFLFCLSEERKCYFKMQSTDIEILRVREKKSHFSSDNDDVVVIVKIQ